MRSVQTHCIRPIYTFRTQIIDIQIKLFDAMLEAECILFIIRTALKQTNLANEAEEKAEALAVTSYNAYSPTHDFH